MKRWLYIYIYIEVIENVNGIYIVIKSRKEGAVKLPPNAVSLISVHPPTLSDLSGNNSLLSQVSELILIQLILHILLVVVFGWQAGDVKFP